MTDNMRFWDQLSKTDPSHTKKFQRAGGFKGTAIKPIYTVQKMTEVFGPAGLGWGTDEPKFETVPGNDGQVAVFCTVGLWINPIEGGQPERVYGVGGDMVVVKQTSGLRTDDEAFKKAYTDAVGNAMKHLGMSADVHMGLFDDSKYVREREAEERAQEAPPRAETGSVVSGATDHLEAALGPSTGSGTLSRYAARPIDGEYRRELETCPSVEAINAFWANPKFQAEFSTFPKSYQDMLTSYRDELIGQFNESAALRESIEAMLRACLTMDGLKAVWEANSKIIAAKTISADAMALDAVKEEMKRTILKVKPAKAAKPIDYDAIVNGESP